MHLNIKLNDEEIRDWEGSPSGRERVLERLRALADAQDIESVGVWAGTIFLGEVAPTRDRALMERLREKNLVLLAELIDPDKNRDDVARNRLAEEIRRVGELFSNPMELERDKRQKERREKKAQEARREVDGPPTETE